MSSLPVNAFPPFGPGIGIWILGFGPWAFISPEYECRIRVFAPASGTIRTINGLFARAVDRMPLMRPRPSASTARIAPHARRGTRLLNDRVRTHAADAPLLIAVPGLIVARGADPGRTIYLHPDPARMSRRHCVSNISPRRGRIAADSGRCSVERLWLAGGRIAGRFDFIWHALLAERASSCAASCHAVCHANRLPRGVPRGNWRPRKHVDGLGRKPRSWLP